MQLHSRARALLLFAVPALLLLGAGGMAQAAQKYVILHQRAGVSVADAVRYRHNLEGIGLNGIGVVIPASTRLMLGGRMSYDEMARQLAPMRGFSSQLTQNFVVLHTRRPPDVFDDWTTLIQNWAALARAAKQAGLAGIFYDDEEYSEPTWTYPKAVKYPQRSLADYRRQWRLRGQQVMQAVSAAFPDIVLLTFHGPYMSDPRTPAAVTLAQLGGRATDLRGLFFIGMVQGAGPRATVVDGGESYQYRSAGDFETSYQWRKYGMAQDSPIIPAELRSSWPSRVSIAFATYNRYWRPKYPMNANIMRTTLANALRRSDQWVWFYVEDHWLQNGVPSDWAQAIRAGVASGGGSAAAYRPPTSRRPVSPKPTTTVRKQAPAKSRTATCKQAPAKPRTTRKRSSSEQSQDSVQAVLEALKGKLKDQTGVDIGWLGGLGQ